MATSTIPKPVDEAKLWEKDLTTWTSYVPAKSIRFGFQTNDNRLLIEAIFSSGDIHRMSWNNAQMWWSYYNHSTDTWSTLATWNKTS